ncbi:MAG: GNAT family N-acetyltransferase [Halobacteriaceae archaeon]
MTVRTADTDDLLAVMRLLDAANLATDARSVEARLAEGTILVAGDPPAGALVARPVESGAHIEAVAVRNARRGQGLGSALVGAAADRWGRLTAEFDPSVRPFYESLDFDIRPAEDGRLWGRR